MERDEIQEQGHGQGQQGGWMPWNWSRQGSAAVVAAEWVKETAEEAIENRQGKSTGFDAGR